MQQLYNRGQKDEQRELRCENIEVKDKVKTKSQNSVGVEK